MAGKRAVPRTSGPPHARTSGGDRGRCRHARRTRDHRRTGAPRGPYDRVRERLLRSAARRARSLSAGRGAAGGSADRRRERRRRGRYEGRGAPDPDRGRSRRTGGGAPGRGLRRGLSRGNRHGAVDAAAPRRPLQRHRLHRRLGAGTRYRARLRRPHRHRRRSEGPFDARSSRPDPFMKFLIVRLGALGDIVHAVPAAAALRRAHPDARIDWLVDARHAGFADLVTSVDRIIRLEKATVNAWVDLVKRLRPQRYDVALDFQGLMKSAVLARASGAGRVVGFSIWHLREKGARPFYSDVDEQAQPAHVIQKNLSLLSTVGIATTEIEFPLARTPSTALGLIKKEMGDRPFALINPGAA